ncbi:MULTISPECIES: helix-turn-helix domain-containing protein [Paracoccus]|uniref:winged helix-turn-helix transcriptional regulator n=1 Tax=Paracoccus TaxID=265 RepID=UPI001E485D2D|nr:MULTISPECIES: helix-turn-helix domain-containing protein [Paracoccus]MDK8875207.1 helix-turn-helix domain-containing protein [Paracoccus sp. SSJ]UFS68478.1 helix-turn-helix transcriptional regulator [Paracoccus denitrificans]
MDVSPSSDPADPMHSDCPGRDLFELITSRWPLLILWSLRGGPQRFYEVRNAVEGISERVLSETLKKLCRHGLITRHVQPSVPPKVSYALTGLGEGLLGVMDGLTGWIGRELENVQAAKRRYDAQEGMA